MMIDIHCHILPGVDDGAADLTVSVEMARLAVAEGIRTIIATPHHRNGRYDNPADKVESAVSELNRELRDQAIPLTVLSGQEVRFNHELLADIDSGQVIGLNRTKYLLLELPSSHIPDEMEPILHELSIMNIIPVIAHTERNAEILADPDKLMSLIDKGALSQITAQSINGFFGSKVQKAAIELCRRQLVHFVASDAHHPKLRKFGLKEAYMRLQESFGEQEPAYYLDNSELLARGGDIRIREPIRRSRKKWYYIFRRDVSLKV